jgi:hypothetical protein
MTKRVFWAALLWVAAAPALAQAPAFTEVFVAVDTGRTRDEGGEADGDPCGAGHHHSHQGREAAAMRAIVAWIRTGRVEATVGE